MYGIMHHKLNGLNVSLEKAEETLGKQFFIELKLIENLIMLDHSVSGFFNPCMLANNVLSEFGFFLRFYERRNKFRFQLWQQISEKNKMRKELSACVISKFNGYEFLRNSLKSKEKKYFIPIDIVYEPTLNDQKPIECFFAPKIEVAYNTNIKLARQGKKKYLP